MGAKLVTSCVSTVELKELVSSSPTSSSPSTLARALTPIPIVSPSTIPWKSKPSPTWTARDCARLRTVHCGAVG